MNNELDEKALEDVKGGVDYETGKEYASKFIETPENKEEKIKDLESQIEVFKSLKAKAGFFQRKKYDKEIAEYSRQIEELKR